MNILTYLIAELRVGCQCRGLGYYSFDTLRAVTERAGYLSGYLYWIQRCVRITCCVNSRYLGLHEDLGPWKSES